jgi:hypothetical protein
MDKIADYAIKCLATAAKYGEVIIITNSDEGWVQFSAERYIPKLIPIIEKYRIVSARTLYEKFYPGQPLCWKAAAFAHEVNESFAAYDDVTQTNSPTSVKGNDHIFDSRHDDTLVSTDNESSDDSMGEEEDEKLTSTLSNRFKGKKSIRREVISFGDSIEERTAVKIVSGQLSAVSKSVMFVSSPTPEQLIGQLSLLTGHMKHVCENQDSLDLEISPQQAEKFASSILRRKKGSRLHASSQRIRHMDEGLKEENNSPLANLTSNQDYDDSTYSL